MRHHQIFGNCQSQPCATRIARFVETVKDVRQVVRWNSRPCIAGGKLGVRAFGKTPHVDRATVRRVTQRVGDQARVGINLAVIAGQRHHQFQENSLAAVAGPQSEGESLWPWLPHGCQRKWTWRRYLAVCGVYRRALWTARLRTDTGTW